MEVRVFRGDALLAIDPTTLLMRPAVSLTLRVTVADPDGGDIRLNAFVRIPNYPALDFELPQEVVERAPGRLVATLELEIDIVRLRHSPILTITAACPHPRGLKVKTHRIKIVVPKREPGAIRSDVDNDGTVSQQDLIGMTDTWRGTGREEDPDPIDANDDGVVDHNDVFQMVQNWRRAGAETPTPVPETPTPVPETPTPVPETPTPVPETPTPVPETPTAVPESPVVVPEPESKMALPKN